MKKKVYWSLCALSIAMAALAAMLTLLSVHSLLLRQVQSSLRDEHKLIARSIAYEGSDWLPYLNTLDIRYDSFRITLVSPDGAVMFDSDNEKMKMENHLDRPEIQAAFQSEIGQDVRRSETMGRDTCYYAAKIPDGNVLRVSMQTRSIGAVFIRIVPLMLGIVLLTLMLSMVLSSRLTRRLLKPIEGLAEDLENADGIKGYDELEPFFAKIREKNNLIGEQVKRLREERDTIKTITSSMREGLLLLNLDRVVLSVNDSALTLLETPEGVYEGKNLLYVSRAAELGECVEQALAGESAHALIQRSGRDCRIFASPVHNVNMAVCGAIVLLLDVTDQQRAELLRREFTANVSHELKTPLTSIYGFAEMIENGMASEPEDVRRFSGRIRTEAQRLIALTDDIIRLSRIEQEGMTDLEQTALRPLCEAAAETLRFAAEQKGVTVTVTGEAPPVYGNAQMLNELLFNLLDNAVKYNRSGGRVEVALRTEAEFAAVTVTDTGIGIPLEHQERIFERFYRVDKSRSKQTGGTGLGLSIVKHIVERHRGTISLHSEAGAGTSITVRLPI